MNNFEGTICPISQGLKGQLQNPAEFESYACMEKIKK